jgi:hypothetical protein
VRLYVSDVAGDDSQPDGKHFKGPEIVVVEPQPPYSHRSLNDFGNDCGENESNCGDDATGNGQHQRPPTIADRKSSCTTTGNTDAAAETTKSNEPSAADAWLSQHQQHTASRTVPLPFPPTHITFDAIDIDTDDDAAVNDGTTGGVAMSSCDESFSQSTETIIARDAEKSPSKKSPAATNSRRKSVYYNAAEQTFSTSGSEAAGGCQSPVVVDIAATLPRHVARSSKGDGGGRKLRGDHVNFASTTVAIESTSRNERRPVATKSGGGSSLKAADRQVRLRGNDDRGPPASSSAAANAPQESSGTQSKSSRHPAKCRVTRIDLHSASSPEANVAAAHVSPPPPTSPAIDKNAAPPPPYYEATIDDYSPPQPSMASTLPPSVGGFRFQAGGGRVETRCAGAGDSSVAAGTLPRDRRPGAVAPTTTRTCGPACVTVTPLGPHVVTVEQCPRFPATRMRNDGGGGREDDEADPMRSLDAVDLLRAEYEASFGGQVNPLLLYSGGLLDEDVNLSKRTVYDNIQYFKV